MSTIETRREQIFRSLSRVKLIVFAVWDVRRYSAGEALFVRENRSRHGRAD